MHSIPLEAFFSCSFRSEDEDINRYFIAICRGLDLQLVNVSTGSPLVPPSDAKERIQKSQAVVAICTKRDELANGSFIMPQSVSDEISIAFGTDTPLLMIIEQDVDRSGFKQNYGTYLEFNRSKIYNPDLLQKCIEAIHKLKLHALGDMQIGSSGISESHAEFVNHLIELKPTSLGLSWFYSTTKKLVYSAASKRPFPLGVWSTVPVKETDQSSNLHWILTLRNSSRNIKLETTIDKHTPSCIEARVRLDPPAEEGDFVEYTTQASSPYINPIWSEDVVEGPSIHLGSGSYQCADGLLFIHRTKKAVVEFRIDHLSKLTRHDIRPFVASYTSSVDYQVQTELDRANIKIEDFGTTLVIRLEIDSPLPSHMYGIAWNPKDKPS